ncbi:hypothetical protein [Paraburkholderia terrae]|uniref:Uncharacterized protein n=1 Tax=Paraburkholderia terrae TaxID=311230 RepID=A0A2I8F047_9BURK|nr:hypothetical protein [Paraburkholderia terrae]AUT64861.1 hypothetical protein C2L65_35135 [Paraburkholderia terrae]
MDNLGAVRQILANETMVWQQSSVISMKLRRFVTTFESLCAYGYKKREKMDEALSARLGLTSVQLSVLEGELFQRGHPTCVCHDVGDYAHVS